MIRSFLFLLVFLSLAHLAAAQANDGFQRRDGSMYLLRNGQAKPMTRDVRLPNGRLITRDGFVVLPTGQRTELRDGQGCTLLGEPTTAIAQANGRTVLASRESGRGNQEAGAAAFRARVLSWSQVYGKGKGHGKGKKRKRKHRDDDDD